MLLLSVSIVLDSVYDAVLFSVLTCDYLLPEPQNTLSRGKFSDINEYSINHKIIQHV